MGAGARTSFAVGSVERTWADVVAAAEERGDWQAVEDEAREGLACLSRQREAGGGPTMQEVREAGKAFRYKYRLLAAEEMEQWLGSWDMTVSDWLHYIRRSLLRERYAGELEELTDRFPPQQAEVDRLCWSTAVCSGALFRFAFTLASRLAVREALAERGEAPSNLESGFEQFCAEVASPEAVQKELVTRQLEWTQVDYESITLPREHMAREALLWLVADRRSMQEVSEATGAPARRTRVFLEDAGEALRDLLMGISPGELRGPVPVDGGFELVLLHGKDAPSVEDEDVQRRARQDMVRRAVQRQVDDRVRWSA